MMALSSRSSNSIELDHYERRSADYAWQLILAAGGILVRIYVISYSNSAVTSNQALNLPLGSFVFTRALTMCLLYLSSALAPAGSQSSIMGLITIPVTYLPYAMIGADSITQNFFLPILMNGQLWMRLRVGLGPPP